MSEHEEQDERPSETEPNPTQQGIDEREDTDKPVDVPRPEEEQDAS